MKDLFELFEQHHVYDYEITYNQNNYQSMLSCLKNNTLPINDTDVIWKMKFDKKYDKQIVFKIMMKQSCHCAILVFSNLCHKDDKDLYRDIFFSLPSIKNNKNIYNYLYAKTIIQDELNKKIRSKIELLKAINYLNQVNDKLFKSVSYYKYLANYFCGNYDVALNYLIMFLSQINFYDPEYCDIYYDKLNIIKLYSELNKIVNKEIYKDFIIKIDNDKTIKFIQIKINKSKNNKCINCKKNKISIDFYNCNHFYCLECITEKNCTFCKNKFIS